LHSEAQRFYEGSIQFSFPMLFSDTATVCEWFEDSNQRFHIEVNVKNKTWGPLFGYRGSFDVQWVPIKDGQIPPDVLPARCERRE
jgi:hypothetical protein